jgi:hypothetical protein
MYPHRDVRFAFAVNTEPGGAYGCVASGNCWFSLQYVFVHTSVIAPDEPAEWSNIKSMFK